MQISSLYDLQLLIHHVDWVLNYNLRCFHCFYLITYIYPIQLKPDR